MLLGKEDRPLLRRSNRTVRLKEAGWEVELDQKHVETLVQHFGLGVGKNAATAAERGESREEFQGQRATLFRNGAMRAAYLAQDRADIAEAVKCVGRGRRNWLSSRVSSAISRATTVNT